MGSPLAFKENKLLVLSTKLGRAAKTDVTDARHKKINRYFIIVKKSHNVITSVLF